ncbi:hypothetical protein C8R47DRAFT_1068816 [Mycena vitilis]|nr:hypothetical protein C8R47DRAFT_1068816 [Mycena vitilis]
MAVWNFTPGHQSRLHLPRRFWSAKWLAIGWQTWYAVSGFNKNPGDSSQGDSYHLTSLTGTDVYLYGTANGSYQVVLDDSTQSFSEATTDLLYSSQALVEESHVVTLRAQPSNASRILGFNRAVISGSQLDSSSLTYSGTWTNNTLQGIPNNTVTAPFHQTVDAGNSVRMNFSGAVAAALYATTNFGHGLYSVSGLDSARTYGLDVTNMSGGAKLSLNSAVTYQVDPPPISTTGSIAEIVAPVVGVIVLGLIAVFVWLRSRKRRETAATAVSPLIIPDRESDPASPEMRSHTTASGKGRVMFAHVGKKSNDLQRSETACDLESTSLASPHMPSKDIGLPRKELQAVAGLARP